MESIYRRVDKQQERRTEERGAVKIGCQMGLQRSNKGCSYRELRFEAVV